MDKRMYDARIREFKKVIATQAETIQELEAQIAILASTPEGTFEVAKPSGEVKKPVTADGAVHKKKITKKVAKKQVKERTEDDDYDELLDDEEL